MNKAILTYIIIDNKDTIKHIRNIFEYHDINYDFYPATASITLTTKLIPSLFNYIFEIKEINIWEQIQKPKDIK